MRHAFPCILLSMLSTVAPIAMAQEPMGDDLVAEEVEGEGHEVGEPVVSMNKSTEQQEDRLLQMLDDMAKTQDDNFCAAASHVLEQSGDELAFPTRMQEMAEKGHPVAMFWLARSLRSGESPYQDEEVAAHFRDLVLKAAEKDYLPAMVQAAQALYYGGNSEEERVQGMEMLMKACKMGSAKARACYLVISGLLTDKNSDLETPEIAAELKHHNYFVEEMIAEAHWGDMSWLRVASEHGSAWAAYELSLRGHLKDKESLAYLRLAAERHMPEAMTTLGCLLCLGPLPADHAPQSLSALPEKALPMAAAETPQAEPEPEPEGAAQNMPPTAESIAEGLQLMRQATSMGDERAAAFLAMAYAGGMGGVVSAERIAALFRFAHERELPYGTAGWGYCLVRGKGCEQNVQLGLSLLERMAKQGVAWATLALAHLYQDGAGVEKNETKAAEYRKAFESEADFTPFLSLKPDTDFFPALK